MRDAGNSSDDLWLESDIANPRGKYKYCSPAQDGLLYPNSAFPFGEEPAADALPSPWQRTPEQTAYARALHEAVAQTKMRRQLGAIVTAAKVVRPQPSAWHWVRTRLRLAR